MSYRLLLILLLLNLQVRSQNYTIVLGRPTNTSISANIVFDRTANCILQYGTSPHLLEQTLLLPQTNPDIPIVAELKNLQPNTQYYYQLLYKLTSSNAFTTSEVYSFHTQRSPDETFTFTIEADEHLYDKKGYAPLYEICLSNQAKDQPDFMISLGDTFGDDHTPNETTSEDMKQLHQDYLKYLGKITHSVPFFFCLGNHEGENGFYLDQNNGQNIAVYGTQWRKYYYPNPYPNNFYSGNMVQEGFGIGYPENYYAFTWGAALFVVLDVYRDCDVNEKPQKWDWTLGEVQYRWFRKTLEESSARFKFVFAHHTRGQGRGAAVTAEGYEWGGYANNKYEFNTYRPGWEKPIHQVMKDEGVDIFFQGHDHLFAWEKVDNVIYQEVPMPSDSSYKIGVTDNGDAYTDLIMDGCGHLKVNVSPECTTVEYIKAYLPKDTLMATHKNAEIAYRYFIGECTTMQNHEQSTGSGLKVFPNPAHDYIEIESTEGLMDEIHLLDLYGKVIKTEFTENLSPKVRMQTQGLMNGVYFIRISQTNGKVFHKKIFISQ